MISDEKRITKALSNLGEFLDFAEWTGRIPSAKSESKYERRLAFWLIHMKQARQGKSSCIWHQEMETAADSRGYLGLFTQDSRTFRFFSMKGKKIGGYDVIRMSDKLTKLGQVQWECTNEESNMVVLSGYRLMRIRDCPSFSDIESAGRHLIGESIGCWKIRGFYELRQDDRTVWYCTRDEDGIPIINKIELPSFQSLTRYMNVIDGKHVDKVISTTLGMGVEDMTGQKIGRWTVVGYSNKAVNNECMWDCVCDCGTLSTVAGGKLRCGKTLSCGCLRKVMFSGSGSLEDGEILEEVSPLVSETENNPSQAVPA